MKEKLKGITLFFFLCFFSLGVIFYLNNDKSKVRDHFGIDIYFSDFFVVYFRNRECFRNGSNFCFFKIKFESPTILELNQIPIPLGFEKWESENEEFVYLNQIRHNFEGYIRSPEEGEKEIDDSAADDFYALYKKESKVYYIFEFINEEEKRGYRIYLFNLSKKELTFFQCPWKLKSKEEEEREGREMLDKL
jgi:hypothetical protein